MAALDPGDVAGLVEAARAGRPDFILFEGVALLDAMREVRRALPQVKIVVDFHNLEGPLYRDVRLARLAAPVRPFARLLLLRRLRAAAAADREAVRIADSVWTCSERDAAAVRAMGEARAVPVVPNPIPSWCGTAGAWAERGAGRRVLFVGHLGYAPNRRAVDELVGAIMPALRQHFADAELHVGGRAPRERQARLLGAHGHRLTADPPDMAPLYRDAAAAVMPLRQGGGTRIKALEALAVGCPVVATAKAVEGLALEDGRHFLRAETTGDFVSALSQLFQDRDLGRRLAAEGRRFVHETHGDAARSQSVRAALAGIGIS
ncbi:glycosyltransferase family 4 protein [Aquibium microcysteis]|uniref:glycosyltransferase family 4 protein n=1 Tax=Aquibium microcysteis TaxID=675281 RepID=UPI00165CF0CB|nr:glycosyltransferase family 4 protein [Aquibium microcysteis]